jgi:hypothetical protein
MLVGRFDLLACNPFIRLAFQVAGCNEKLCVGHFIDLGQSLGLPGAMVIAGVNGAPDRFGETRMNAFGPRLGIAYQLNSKTVLRTAGAIYYQPSREDGNADNGIQGFGGTFSTIGNFLSNGVSYLVKDGFTGFAPQIAAIRPPITDPAVLSRNLIQQGPFLYFPKAGRASYFADWNFTVERSITERSVARLSYH